MLILTTVTLMLPRKIFAEYLTESNCLFVKYPV